MTPSRFCSVSLSSCLICLFSNVLLIFFCFFALSFSLCLSLCLSLRGMQAPTVCQKETHTYKLLKETTKQDRSRCGTFAWDCLPQKCLLITEAFPDGRSTFPDSPLYTLRVTVSVSVCKERPTARKRKRAVLSLGNKSVNWRNSALKNYSSVCIDNWILSEAEPCLFSPVQLHWLYLIHCGFLVQTGRISRNNTSRKVKLLIAGHFFLFAHVYIYSQFCFSNSILVVPGDQELGSRVIMFVKKNKTCRYICKAFCVEHFAWICCCRYSFNSQHLIPLLPVKTGPISEASWEVSLGGGHVLFSTIWVKLKSKMNISLILTENSERGMKKMILIWLSDGSRVKTSHLQQQTGASSCHAAF